MRESIIEEYLVHCVKAMGGEVRKLEWIARRGAPDRVVMLPSQSGPIGRTLWIELKATGVAPKPHQVREHQRMQKMGQRVEVVDSLARVEEVLEK